MIVISNPNAIANEIKLIHSLFEEGLKLFHVRKPDFSEQEMQSFLSKIAVENRSKLVLHQHHQLAENFGINRIHFTENKRAELDLASDKFSKAVGCISTSAHNISDFNSLNPVFDYAFISPIYPSISKENYVPHCDFALEIKKRTNFNTHLIALGGITPENIKKTLSLGFDAIALLGTIWNSPNPIENFKLCQQIVRSH